MIEFSSHATSRSITQYENERNKSLTKDIADSIERKKHKKKEKLKQAMRIIIEHQEAIASTSIVRFSQPSITIRVDSGKSLFRAVTWKLPVTNTW